MYSTLINTGSKPKLMHEKEYTSYVITTHLFPSGGHHWDHQYTYGLGEDLVPIRRQAFAWTNVDQVS